MGKLMSLRIISGRELGMATFVLLALVAGEVKVLAAMEVLAADEAIVTGEMDHNSSICSNIQHFILPVVAAVLVVLMT